MILHGKSIKDNRVITLHIKGEKISRIEPFRKGRGLDRIPPDLYIAPGFFDLQVNGFAGIDFNGKGLTVDDVHRAALALSGTGVTTFFPALITASFERLVHQLKIVREPIENDLLVSKMCKGIHLEGPYISPVKGPRGVDSHQFIRPPRWDEFEKLQEACGGRIKLVTLAPEGEGSLDFVRKAVSSGLVVSIGHTNASDEILQAAFEARSRRKAIHPFGEWYWK